MRYKAVFIAGVAVGFVAGARAGREAYDKLVGYGHQIAEHPKVQQATSTVQAKTTELTKTAAEKAPDYLSSAASTVSAQVPKVASAARHAATEKIPAMFGGGRGSAGHEDPAADGAGAGGPDDVGPDGHLIYPADGESSAGGVRFTPDTP